MNISFRARVLRYPAKMVPQFADKIFNSSVDGAQNILDPFCGSGEVMVGAMNRGINSIGIDINPYAVLLSQVRLEGFDRFMAANILNEFLSIASMECVSIPIAWSNKSYWFSPRVIEKIEAMRAAAISLRLARSREGRSVLLAMAQGIRLCSRADDRSPKPFISKGARAAKEGRHLDPIQIVRSLHESLASSKYFANRGAQAKVFAGDVTGDRVWRNIRAPVSHVVTSPPYLNAQDYFRNFKLELYVMEGLLPYEVDKIAENFVGTERGLRKASPTGENVEVHQYLRGLDASIGAVETKDKRLGLMMYRYFSDMQKVFSNIGNVLSTTGTIILVCGDNLVAGIEVKTGAVLCAILKDFGYKLESTFSDPILARSLPPNRTGHLGLIKEETVYKFVA